MSLSADRIARAVIPAMVVGAIGFALGEYAPFTGGLASIAEPFSQIRNETAVGYAVLGAILGAITGPFAIGQMSQEWTCPECAETISPEARTCKHCGCVLVPVNEARGNFSVVKTDERLHHRECPHCAEGISRQARTCEHCGRAVVPVNEGSSDYSASTTHLIASARHTGRRTTRVPLKGDSFEKPPSVGVFVLVGLLLLLGAYTLFPEARSFASTLTTSIAARNITTMPEGRFVKVEGGRTDTISFINGWGVRIHVNDRATNVPTRIVAYSGQQYSETTFKRVVVGQDTVKDAFCQLVPTGTLGQWTCRATGMMAAWARAVGQDASITVAKDARGVFLPEQPATNMERVRLTPLP